MKILTRYIIKEHIGPFFFALSVIMFILLMNFLVKYIGQIFGKGLEIFTIFKLIALNLAWMLALAVPMATLVAVLMAYGRFSADNEITILKSSGISIFKIMRPSLYLGIILTLIMVYFSDQILPESNHEARRMFQAIRRKKPTLQLEEHIFYDLSRFSFVVDQIEKPLEDEWLGLNSLLGPEYRNPDDLERLRNITIFDRTDQGKTTTIIAEEGYMVYSRPRKSLVFTLFNGEFHEIDNEKLGEYQRSSFSKHIVYIPADDFELEQEEDSYRGDREMNIKMMQAKIEETRQQMMEQKNKIGENIDKNSESAISLIKKMESDPGILPADSAMIASIDTVKWKIAHRKALNQTDRYYQRMRTNQNLVKNNEQTINKFSVEVHKKISIPFASIVFVLIGAPLGIMARKGSMGIAISMSIGFFLLYWVFLIGGEDLADRQLLTPFFAMWAANIIVGIGGIYLTWRAIKETSFINWGKLQSFFKWGKTPPQKSGETSI
ncbi:MAG: LptF/LptG family permease [Calditrichaceae bacterium]